MITLRNGTQVNAYGVGQINQYIKRMFTGDLLLQKVFVKGEVSNLKYHDSGHIYFSLKDETGTLAAVMFAGSRAKGLTFRMQEGQQVVVYGSIEVYEVTGKYQLYAKQIVLDGAGQLYERFLQLKRELEEMGMFAPEYKKPIPKYAGRVGIVTAETGAAIRDIESVSHKRNPYVQLVLYPARVQGEGAAESIVRGIKRLQEEQVDVIIVGRGGGSIEDLWAFNEEIVARAIFECSIPVVSAVGHETDTTICDYVADLRVPTPTAAAQTCVYRVDELQNELLRNQLKLKGEMERVLLGYHHQVTVAEKKLVMLSPEYRLRENRNKLARIWDQMDVSMDKKLQGTKSVISYDGQRLKNLMDRDFSRWKNRYLLMLEKFKGLNPVSRLEMGFSYTETADGKALTSVGQVNQGDMLRIHVTDGIIMAETRDAKQM